MKSIWAIARNLVIEVLKKRDLMVVWGLFVLASTGLLGWWLLQDEGQADQKVQTFISYSLKLNTWVLTLIVIFLSISSVSRDIKQKQIFMIATKPISRGGFLAGKLVGMALVNLLFLGVAAVLIYAVAVNLPRFMETSELEQQRLNQLVYTARTAVDPEYEDVRAEVEQWVNEMVRKKIQEEPEIYKNDPALVEKMRRVLWAEREKELILKQTAIAPGEHKVMHFKEVLPRDRENGYIFIRVKNDVSVNPPSLKVYGQWAVGPKDPMLHGGYRFSTYDEIRTFHEYPVPADAASAEGDLYVYFRNPLENRRTTIIYEQGTGIQALYTQGGFNANFLKTTAMVYMRLSFFTILGVMAGAWLSFPVAVLLSLTVYVLGAAMSFIFEALNMESLAFLSQLMEILFIAFPNLGKYDPIQFIEKGRYVNEALMGNFFLNVVLLKGGVITVLGYLLFKYKELARVIV